MGKVLHASYSGYFPWCESDVSLSPFEFSGSLAQIMYAWWRVKSWNYNYFYDDGDGNSMSGGVQLFQFGVSGQITDETQLVCLNSGFNLRPEYSEEIPNLFDNVGILSMGGSHKINSYSNNQIGFDFLLEGNDEFWEGAQFDSYGQEIGSMYISFPGLTLTKTIYSARIGPPNFNSCIVSLTANSYWEYN